MRDSVSIRNTKAATSRATVNLGNSESSCVDDVVRLLPLWPRDIADRSLEGRKKIVAVLERALRQERRRGHAGHSAYDDRAARGSLSSLEDGKSGVGCAAIRAAPLIAGSGAQ